ncbi:MAG: class I mannose-6-phosphate isomerase [Verrucomicrobiota bacterium]|nr:class I mannose-6-phosphate isomerase [Verrucomicrobiota bacterium]
MTQPLRFQPVYQTHFWGGDRIAKFFQRKNVPTRVAESWELSASPEGMSISTHGKSLESLVREMGESLLGRGQDLSRFPLLLKLLDAREPLPIEVHPTQPKLFYAFGPSQTYLGLKVGLSAKHLHTSAQAGTLPDRLQTLSFPRGSLLYIPPGTAHALLAGSFGLELTVDSTPAYRLYDWNRTGFDGKPRPLHLEQGLLALSEAAHAQPAPALLEQESTHQIFRLIDVPFCFDKVRSESEYRPRLNPSTFLIFFCEEGTGELFCDGHAEQVQPGMTFLIPAAAKEVQFYGRFTLLQISLPGKENH